MRFEENILGRANLLNPATAHDHHAVSHGEGFGLAVGDIDEGDAKVLLQPSQHRLHAHAQVRIEGTERFVQQQYRGLGDQ